MLHINQPLGEKMIPKKEGEISIRLDGKEYPGHYRVEGTLVKVFCAYGTKTTQLSSSGADPEQLARILLREIIKAKLKK
jgi:hypothetical protein